MSIFIGKSGQNIFDIAFMCYGEYNVLKLMAENSFITDVNYTDFAGKKINYTAVKNNASFYNGLSHKIMNTGTFITKSIGDFLLKEDGFYILQENGDKIIL